MIQLNPDPQIAEQQIEAIIFYLTACGYIDSEFDLSEKAFVRAYLRKLVTARIDSHGESMSPELRYERIEQLHEHYVERFQEIDHDVRGLFTEAVADGEDYELLFTAAGVVPDTIADGVTVTRIGDAVVPAPGNPRVLIADGSGSVDGTTIGWEHGA